MVRIFIEADPNTLLPSTKYLEKTPLTTITALLSELPYEHSMLLKYLLKLLRHVAAHHESNEMTAHDLAVCIGPNIFRLPETSLESSRKSAAIIYKSFELLIERAPDLYPVPNKNNYLSLSLSLSYFYYFRIWINSTWRK